MGYSTGFTGSFKITPELKATDLDFLTKLNRTRRMARKVGPEFGVEGEFFVDGGDSDMNFGPNKDASIIDYNTPPKTQPGLWCGWVPSVDGKVIEWDGGEKFYYYVEWIQYIVDKILKPRGYKLDGEVTWEGEDSDDRGKIIAKNNKVTTKLGKVVYE